MRMRALLISANVFVVQTKLHFSLLVKYNIQSIAFLIHVCMGFDKELFLITVITYLDEILFQEFWNSTIFQLKKILLQ